MGSLFQTFASINRSLTRLEIDLIIAVGGTVKTIRHAWQLGWSPEHITRTRIAWAGFMKSMTDPERQVCLCILITGNRSFHPSTPSTTCFCAHFSVLEIYKLCVTALRHIYIPLVCRKPRRQYNPMLIIPDTTGTTYILYV